MSSKKAWNEETVWTLAAFSIFFLLSMLRFCGFGVTYFPQLDDYIQYRNYPMAGDFSTLAASVGLLASRPLAGIADYFLWGRLFSHMILGVALVTALYVAAMVQLRRLLQRYFRVSPLFLVITCLLPVGMEGLYWMSASTRIVAGLFTGVLAASAFARWLDKGRWYRALLYAVLQLLPFGFYEQCAVWSMTLALGMGLLEIRKRWKRSLLALWTLPAMAAYFQLLAILTAGNPYASRLETVPITSPYYQDVFLPEVLRHLWSAFFDGTLRTLGKGCIRGLSLLTVPGQLLWLALTLPACTGLLWLLCQNPKPYASPKKRRKFNPWLGLLAGFLLALAPVTPFFIIANPWISLRAVVPSLAGFALMVESVLALLPGWKRSRWICPILSSALALVFSIAALSEIHDYRETYLYDQQTAAVTLAALKRDNVPSDEKVGILNMEPSCLLEQNFYYHEHIHGCAESLWAFSGLLTATSGKDHAAVTPMGTQLYRRWNREANHPETFDRLYYYTGDELVPVTLETEGENQFTVRFSSGETAGTIWEDEAQTGYFTPAAQRYGKREEK